jgi:hypothetical protein
MTNCIFTNFIHFNEMYQLFKMQTIKPTQGKIDYLISLMSIKDIESIMKTAQKRKYQGQSISLMNSMIYLRDK